MGKGLYNKYEVRKANKEPIPNGAEYFVLRLDSLQSDGNHRSACIAAVLKYAEEIEPYIPELALDIKNKYGKD